jgi:hypothetical protein
MMTKSPFQECIEVLQDTARQMWKNGVEGKDLFQHEYLWPMTAALQKYEAALTDKVYVPPPSDSRPMTVAEREELRQRFAPKRRRWWARG